MGGGTAEGKFTGESHFYGVVLTDMIHGPRQFSATLCADEALGVEQRLAADMAFRRNEKVDNITEHQ